MEEDTTTIENNFATFDSEKTTEKYEASIQLEQHLLTLKESFCYALPKLGIAGYRADTWDLKNPIFTGQLKIFQTDDELFIRLYEPIEEKKHVYCTELNAGDLQLFAECPIRLNEKEKKLEHFVDETVDSARRFGIRCQDKITKKVAWIGLGFRSRELSFSFRATLQDFVRYQDRKKIATMQRNEALKQENEDEEDHNDDNLPIKAIKDMTLKEGEKLKINLKIPTVPGKSKKNKISKQSLKILPPRPPSISTVSSSTSDNTPEKIVVVNEITSNENDNSNTDDDDDDWGDFNEA